MGAAGRVRLRGEAGVDRGGDGRSGDDRPGHDRTAAEFEAIVAGLRREGAVPAWPGTEADRDRPPAEPPRTPTALPAVGPADVPADPPVRRPAPAPAPEPEPDDEHFVPPEPPPLPRPGPPALVGAVLLGLGLVLVTAPGLVGVPDVYGLPLGLLALACGLGWLVLRLWPGPDDEGPGGHGGDDGAQV
jgi:hypothetical protein